MADTTETTTGKRPWIETLVLNARPAGYVLFALALGLGALAVYLGLTYKEPKWPLWVYCGLVAVSLAAAGLWFVLFNGQSADATDAVRLCVLSLGGTIGLLTVLLGGVLGYRWWDDILVLTQAGGPDPVKVTGSARTNAILKAVLPLPILIVGMAIAFASLLLARGDERSSAFLRRLLYGYNAVVQGLLAVLILVVANVYVTMKFSKPIDFTTSSFYSLSPTSETLLQALDKPVKVIVLLDPNEGEDPQGPPGAFLLSMVRPMLTNCQAVTDKLEVEYLIPDPSTNPARFDELAKKGYELGEGMLVIYGAAGNEKGESKLIKKADLTSRDFRGDGRSVEFVGENALMSEIDLFTMGRKKTIVYFTQGNGELDIKDTSPVNPERRRLMLDNRGSGILKERLEKHNMEVKPLDLGGIKPEVPPDADLVAILGPKKTLGEAAVRALDDYMARKGKLLVLLGPEQGPSGNVQRTGLEELLARYNVQIPPEIIYAARSQSPFVILAEPNARFEKNPLVKNFMAKGGRPAKPFLMVSARPVRPAGVPPGASPFTTEAVLQADPRLWPWTETDMAIPVERLLREMSGNRDLLARKVQPNLDNPLPVAVAVSESSMPNPHMGMMAPPPSGPQTPRLVVIGSVTLASNARTTDMVDADDFDYMEGCINWLREKTNSIGISPKKTTIFSLREALQQSGSYWGFVLLPSVVICLGVIAAGGGVWLVRRR
jgi:ABC-type uncharacterized transport system